MSYTDGQLFIALEDSDADVVLRSSDFVEIRSHRRVLSRASPFFADLFSLPGPFHGASGSDKGRLPVICMAEDEVSLRILLSLCEVETEPHITTLDELLIAARLVSKFELSASSIVGHFLLRGRGSKAATWQTGAIF